MSKPFIRWVGGKTSLLPQLLNKMPDSYNKYFEPFLGGGAMFFKIGPKSAYLSDINVDLINLYIVVRNKLNRLLKDLKRHTNTEKYYYSIREEDRNENFKSTEEHFGDVYKASRILYLNKTCWNGVYRVNSKGQFNVPFGKLKNPKIVDENVLRSCSSILQNAQIASLSFEEILPFVSKNDFIYLDPPYVPLNETSFTSYTKDGFGKKEQEELKEFCDELDKLGAYFMHSNSHTDFIKNLYRGYNIHSVYAPRYINSDGKGRGNVTEVLINNYESKREQLTMF